MTCVTFNAAATRAFTALTRFVFIVVAAAAALSFCASTAFGQLPRSLSGRWVLDEGALALTGGGRGDASGNASGGGGGAGGGIGLGPPGTELTIQHTDSTVRVFVAREDGSGAVITYRPTGKPTKNPLLIGRGAATDAVYRSVWDGAALASSIARIISARGTNTELQYRERIYLQSDSVLAVEISLAGRPGGRTALYRRSPPPQTAAPCRREDPSSTAPAGQ